MEITIKRNLIIPSIIKPGRKELVPRAAFTGAVTDGTAGLDELPLQPHEQYLNVGCAAPVSFSVNA
jgi:hypothetical protein